MAGDWIKMRDNLWSDPRVSRLCDLTAKGKAAVIGGLYWLWSSADQHSVDGTLPALTLKGIDRETGIRGFAKALTDPKVRWLEEGQEGVSIPRFDQHNGASAKRRAVETKRKELSRTGTKSERMSAWREDKMRTERGQQADNERTEGGQSTDAVRAREEKRRDISRPTAVEDSSIPASDVPKAVGSDSPPDPDFLLRIAAECARAKADDANIDNPLILRWVAEGATPSQVITALAEARKPGCKSLPAALPLAYVDAILVKILEADRQARATQDARAKRTQDEIEAGRQAAAAKVPPPPDLVKRYAHKSA